AAVLSALSAAADACLTQAFPPRRHAHRPPTLEGYRKADVPVRHHATIGRTARMDWAVERARIATDAPLSSAGGIPRCLPRGQFAPMLLRHRKDCRQCLTA